MDGQPAKIPCKKVLKCYLSQFTNCASILLFFFLVWIDDGLFVHVFLFLLNLVKQCCIGLYHCFWMWINGVLLVYIHVFECE